MVPTVWCGEGNTVMSNPWNYFACRRDLGNSEYRVIYLLWNYSLKVSIFIFCSDFPYVVPECGYKEAKEAVCQLAQQVNLSSSELEWIMGKTVKQIFNKHW